MRPTLARPALPLLFILLTVVPAAIGCSSPDAAETADPASEAPQAAATDEAAAGGELAPITSRSGSGNQVASGDEIAAPGAVFRLPESWQQEQPSSGMRLAQASIPGEGGPGQLTVFYFGPGGGGGVDANLQRWIGQMAVDPSTTPQRDTFEVAAYKVTWIQVEGTLQPSTMGVGPTEAQPDSMLLGAVIEGNQGPWFFKATGPEATLVAEKENFLAMLRSARIP